MARAARSLIKLRDQINAKFPYRDKASDGGIGDARHQATKSDHNPDANGVFHAYDFDHDPDHNGLNCVTLNRELKACRDPRIKYVIFQRRIWWPNGVERAYTGVNAHTSHLHLSVLPGAKLGDFNGAWDLPMLSTTPISVPAVGPVKVPQTYGMSVDQVKSLQKVLNAWYPTQVNLVIDGDYGPKTIKAVEYAQGRLKVKVDGIAGPVTRKALGLKF